MSTMFQSPVFQESTYGRLYEINTFPRFGIFVGVMALFYNITLLLRLHLEIDPAPMVLRTSQCFHLLQYCCLQLRLTASQRGSLEQAWERSLQSDQKLLITAKTLFQIVVHGMYGLTLRKLFYMHLSVKHRIEQFLVIIRVEISVYHTLKVLL